MGITGSSIRDRALRDNISDAEALKRLSAEAILMDEARAKFEERIFGFRFIKSIERNQSPPRGTGAFDFISVDCPTMAEFCVRDGESYKDPFVAGGWVGWKLANNLRA